MPLVHTFQERKGGLLLVPHHPGHPTVGLRSWACTHPSYGCGGGSLTLRAIAPTCKARSHPLLQPLLRVARPSQLSTSQEGSLSVPLLRSLLRIVSAGVASAFIKVDLHRDQSLSIMNFEATQAPLYRTSPSGSLLE